MNAQRGCKMTAALIAVVFSWLNLLAASAAEPQPPAAKPQTIQVAGIVLKWLGGDKEANYRRVEPLMRKAAAHRARIVCTTESRLDGDAIAVQSIPLEQVR